MGFVFMAARKCSEFSNIGNVHGTLLLVKARTLKRLGSFDAATRICTFAMKRSSARSDDLLKDLMYERGLIFEAMGKRFRAAFDFQRLYTTDPSYRDVARRLGLESVTYL